MNLEQIKMVRSSWQMVSTIDPVAVGELFYNRLFQIAPGVKSMFRSPMADQSKKLLSMIGYVISKLDKLNEITDEVAKLSRRHVNYGVKAWHYEVVGEAFLWTLEKGLGSHWNEELKQAWTVCYTTLSSAMIGAVEESRDAA